MTRAADAARGALTRCSSRRHAFRLYNALRLHVFSPLRCTPSSSLYLRLQNAVPPPRQRRIRRAPPLFSRSASAPRASLVATGNTGRTAVRRAANNFSSGARKEAPLVSPVNLPKWLEENSHLLKPPINNYCVYNKDMTVMIVGGPNQRTDYHINETPEWFYQYKGRMLLKVVDADHTPSPFRDIYINEGEMFLLPPNTPHNPVRFADTVGIVLEQHRPADSLDRLRWYCQNCGEQVHEKSFHCTDLGTQIKEAVNAFKEDTQARTCGSCGTLCDVAPRKA